MKTHFVDIKTLKHVLKRTVWKTWHLHRKLANSVINDQPLVERLLHDQKRVQKTDLYFNNLH